MKRHVLPISLILVISFALYANTLKNDFLLDDYDTVVNNSLITNFHNLPELFNKDSYFRLSGEMSYRPFVTFTYFIDYRLYGLNPWGYHLTNTLLHAVNGVMLYIFMTLLLRPSTVCAQQQKILSAVFSNRPLLISLLFAPHPVLTEAVNGISFREDLLVFLFYTSTLTLYLIFRNKRIIETTYFSLAIYFLSCILYFLALFSKEMAVTLPLVVICYEWIYSDKKIRLLLFNIYNIGYIAITFIYVYIRFYCFYTTDIAYNAYTTSWGLREKIFTIPWLILNYFKMISFPISLTIHHEINSTKFIFSSQFIGSIIAAFILFTILILKKHKTEIVFGLLFFVITLLPVYNIYPLTMPFAERYIYLPLIGFVITTGSIISSMAKSHSEAKKQKIYMLIYFILLALYSYGVIKRNAIWKDDYSFWSDAVRKGSNSGFAHHNLGVVYIYQNRLDEAEQEIINAIKLNPFDPNYHASIAIVYDRQGKLDEAISELDISLRIAPNDSISHYNLGVLYLKKEARDKAKQQFEIALKLNPDYVQAQQALKSIY